MTNVATRVRYPHLAVCRPSLSSSAHIPLCSTQSRSYTARMPDTHPCFINAVAARAFEPACFSTELFDRRSQRGPAIFSARGGDIAVKIAIKFSRPRIVSTFRINLLSFRFTCAAYTSGNEVYILFKARLKYLPHFFAR